MATHAAGSARNRLMNGQDYRDSLRKYRPTVFVDGRLIESVVDSPLLQPGINALAVTYDFALDPARAPLMTARQSVSGKTVNRMLHINESAGDLLKRSPGIPPVLGGG
jgi:4-hydroxybutyryl-CoA dehydratase/vinylacetyl-CoA-Delta-isomerase